MAEGRVVRMVAERDGYRIQLDRSGYVFWAPARSVRSNDIRVGASIRLGGILRGGSVYVDVIESLRAPSRVYVRGRIDRIDRGRGVLYVRDEFSRRTIAVATERLDRASRRFDLDDFRRGDSINVYGDWGAHGTLVAYRIEKRER